MNGVVADHHLRQRQIGRLFAVLVNCIPRNNITAVQFYRAAGIKLLMGDVEVVNDFLLQSLILSIYHVDHTIQDMIESSF